MIPSPSSRRAAIDRWIVSLTPFFEVITGRVKKLKLGDPALQIGPTFIKKDSPSGVDKIRRGAIWFVKDVGRVGFHVDFMKAGIRIEAFTGRDRTAELMVAGKVSEETLKKDLNLILVAAGLTDVAKTEEVRASLFSGRNLKEVNALDKA